MKTRFFWTVLVSLFVIALLTPAIVTAAKPDNPGEKRPRVVIPPHAVEVAPGIFSLGTALDKGRVVEGYAIITYRKGFGKPPCNNNGVCEPGEKKSCADCRNGGDKEPDTSGCYEFTRGAKWKTVEPYVVNPTNVRGLDEALIIDNLSWDIDKWEIAAELDIIGNGSSTTEALEADFDEPDNENEVYFADIAEENAIAFTIVWGIFRGPPPWRELVEWDQVYDDVTFDWSQDCLAEGEDCSQKMDFENIATHELGHSVGLSDLYDAKCSEQTMYGYAAYGETKKSTLEDGDITGIYKLYH